MPKTYTIMQFQADYPDDDACLNKIMELRHGRSHFCSECKRTSKFHRIARRRAYACQFCGVHLYPCAGTIFEKSTTPLRKWFYAMYLFTTTRHEVPAKELERQLGVTYKCAWRMAHEIRKLMGELDIGGLFGEVEVDETYVGGKRSGKRGRGAQGKTVVAGIKQRNGPVKTQVVKDAKTQTIEPIVRDRVRQGSTVHSDEWWAYKRLGAHGYDHQSVNHGAGEYVRGECHTNSIEGHWARLKLSIRGTHVHVSGKHLPKYLAEFDFRHNFRKVPDQMFSILVDRLQHEPPA